MFWGSTMTVSKQLWGPRGYVLASSAVSETRSNNIKTRFKKMFVKFALEANLYPGPRVAKLEKNNNMLN